MKKLNEIEDECLDALIGVEKAAGDVWDGRTDTIKLRKAYGLPMVLKIRQRIGKELAQLDRVIAKWKDETHGL